MAIGKITNMVASSLCQAILVLPLDQRAWLNWQGTQRQPQGRPPHALHHFCVPCPGNGTICAAHSSACSPGVGRSSAWRTHDARRNPRLCWPVTRGPWPAASSPSASLGPTWAPSSTRSARASGPLSLPEAALPCCCCIPPTPQAWKWVRPIDLVPPPPPPPGRHQCSLVRETQAEWGLSRVSLRPPIIPSSHTELGTRI